MQLLALILVSAMLFHGIKGLIEATAPIRRHLAKTTPRLQPIEPRSSRSLLVTRPRVLSH